MGAANPLMSAVRTRLASRLDHTCCAQSVVGLIAAGSSCSPTAPATSAPLTLRAGCGPTAGCREAERHPHHPRHDARRSPGLLRECRRADAGPRRPRAPRHALRAGRDARAADAARALLDHDGPLSDVSRRPPERHHGARPGPDDACRSARRAGLPDGRVHRGLRARRPLGAQSGLSAPTTTGSI